MKKGGLNGKNQTQITIANNYNNVSNKYYSKCNFINKL